MSSKPRPLLVITLTKHDISLWLLIILPHVLVSPFLCVKKHVFATKTSIICLSSSRNVAKSHPMSPGTEVGKALRTKYFDDWEAQIFQKPGWLMIIEDYTTQYIGNYNIPRTGNMGNPYANYQLAIYGGFHKWRYPKWMVYHGKSYEHGW